MSEAAHRDVMRAATEAIVQHAGSRDTGPVVSTEDVHQIRADLARHFTYEEPMEPAVLIGMVEERLAKWQVHTTHRQYWGLYNPDVLPVTVAADALVAAFNPQLAAWSHAPGPNEMERHVLGVFMRALGWSEEESFATFTSGGAEANLTGVLTGLTSVVEGFAEDGSPGGVRLYVSQEAHHSVVKIAHMCGVGRRAIREVEVDSALGMRPDALREAIGQDRRDGLRPAIVFATLGTTAAGASDPISALADIAAKEGLWLHVDAAWAGAALLSEVLRPHLDGLERADSITADAHKWMSVPMGAGMSFVRDRSAAEKTFAIQTRYMPDNEGTPDPYTTTAQWSRRFIGLKVFMAMATMGVEGYARQIERQAKLASTLKERLREEGWRVVNESPFAVVCFTRDGCDPRAVASRLQKAHTAWISATNLTHHGDVLRACVTNYRSDESDVERLVAALREAL